MSKYDIGQTFVHLANGYYLSRITGSFAHSYPYHCEFAVINSEHKIVYDTPLTDDVVVCMNEQDEKEFLETAYLWGGKPK